MSALRADLRAVLIGSPDLLFDLDEVRIAAWSVALAEEGIAWEWTPERRRAVLHGDPKEMIEAAGRAEELWIDPEATLIRVQRILETGRMPRPRTRAGSSEFLSRASARDLRVAVVSDLPGLAPALAALPGSPALYPGHRAAITGLDVPADSIRAIEADAAGADLARAAGLAPIRAERLTPDLLD